MRTWLIAITCVCPMFACGEPASPPPVAPVRVAPPPKPPEAPKPPPGALWRDDVDRTVDAGVARFLQRIDVEASLDQGMFQGFRIVSLHPDDYWRGVDLHPGDVILQINGKAIEDPYDAYDVMQSLKSSDHLTIDFLRGGKRLELTYRIIAKPGNKTPSPAPSADASTN